VQLYIANLEAIAASAKAGQELSRKRLQKLKEGEQIAMSEDLAAFGARGVDLDDEEERPDGVDSILAVEWQEGDQFTEEDRLNSFRSKIRLQRPTTGVRDGRGLIRKTHDIARQYKLFDAAPGPRRVTARHLAGTADVVQGVYAAKKALESRRTEVLANAIASGQLQPQPAKPFRLVQDKPPRPAALVQLAPSRTIDQIVNEMHPKLTPHQELAFRVVAETVHAELQRQLDPTLPPVPQLQMYVGGGGGTGKSYVIKALQALFKEWSRESWLISTATTGLAAFNIQGRTFDSACSLTLDSSDRVENSDIRSISHATRLLLKCAKFMIVDEVSMLSAVKLGHASRNLKKVRDSEEHHHLPMGGMHMVYFGDFFQLTPAGGGVPLYDGQKAAYSLRSAHDIGRQLWDSLTHVVFLHRNKRAERDAEWTAMLERLRYGVATDADFVLVNSRVLTDTNKPADNPEDPEVPRPLWVFGYDVQRTDFNIFSVIQQATRERQTIMLCYGRDELMGLTKQKRRGQGGRGAKQKQTRRKPLGNLKTEQAQECLLMPENDTDYLPGVLPLIKGMPIYMKKNLAVVLGICNGSQGVLERVVLDEREPPVPQWQPGDTAPIQHALKYLPKALLVRFPGCGLTEPLNPDLSLDPKVIAIEPSTGSFVYADKWDIRRRQFCLLPGYARTLHSTQSETALNITADLNVGFPCANSSYVILSRPVHRDAIVLMQHFKKELLRRAPPAELLREQHRLEAIHDKTAQRYFKKIPELLKDHQDHIHQRIELLSAFFQLHGDQPAPPFEPPKLAGQAGKRRRAKKGDPTYNDILRPVPRVRKPLFSRNAAKQRGKPAAKAEPKAAHPQIRLSIPVTPSDLRQKAKQLREWHAKGKPQRGLNIVCEDCGSALGTRCKPGCFGFEPRDVDDIDRGRVLLATANSPMPPPYCYGHRSKSQPRPAGLAH
jgi:hypothetical protein